MFKFLKSLRAADRSKPGGTTKPKAGAKPAGAKPASTARPPDPMTPLSAPPGGPRQDMPDEAPSLHLEPERPMTVDRAQLIQKALSVHRSQQSVFSELDQAARQKLTLMAMLMLLKEARKQK